MGLAGRADRHAVKGTESEGDMLTLTRPVGPAPAAVPVWSSGVGLARTLLALGTLGTLAASEPAALMSPLANGVVPPACDGARPAGIWCCHAEPGARPMAVGRGSCCWSLSGWRPRLTAIPHWYVSSSLIVNATLQDGGDQITAVLTFCCCRSA